MDDDDSKITSITIGRARRCPTCGGLPPEFPDPRRGFERRVENLYIIPEKSEHWTADKDGNPQRHYPAKECVSPPGLYTGVIVPKYLVGRVLVLIPKEE